MEDGDGSGFAKEFVSILRMQNAALPKNEISLVVARIRGALAFAAAGRQMRRLFESCGGAARQDFLIAVDADVSSEDENGDAAWLAYRNAKKTRDFATKEES